MPYVDRPKLVAVVGLAIIRRVRRTSVALQSVFARPEGTDGAVFANRLHDFGPARRLQAVRRDEIRISFASNLNGATVCFSCRYTIAHRLPINLQGMNPKE